MTDNLTKRVKDANQERISEMARFTVPPLLSLINDLEAARLEALRERDEALARIEQMEQDAEDNAFERDLLS